HRQATRHHPLGGADQHLSPRAPLLPRTLTSAAMPRRSTPFAPEAMPPKLSPRLAAIVEALPLRGGMRVLEIGCGPGVAARAVLQRVGTGHVLAIDRSAKAIAQAVASS